MSAMAVARPFVSMPTIAFDALDFLAEQRFAVAPYSRDGEFRRIDEQVVTHLIPASLSPASDREHAFAVGDPCGCLQSISKPSDEGQA